MPRLSDLWAVLDPMVDTVVEQPDGSNHAPPVTDWYYHWDDYWCAMSVSYGLAHGGWSDDDGETLAIKDMAPGIVQTTPKGWSWVPSIEETFDALGRFDQTPREGDIFITPAQTHTGFVRKVHDDGTISTREGNYENRFAAVRRVAADLRGFCHPPYDDPQEGFPMALTDEQQERVLDMSESTNAAVGRIEVAVRDQTGGLGAKLDEVLVELRKLNDGPR